MIRKPGIDNSMKQKPIPTRSLLSCYGKVVEKVVAQLLSEVTQRRGLQSDGKFGRRKGRAAINTVAIMINQSQAARTNDQISGGLLMVV
jgi:hypothetical protein